MNHLSSYVKQQPSLLYSTELESVITRCRKRVEQIARDCRAHNRKFRDVEFDLENDQNRCLYGLFARAGENFSPADVLRCTKIFKDPRFFANGSPDSTKIVQGSIGDCWFLSALSCIATAPGLLEQLCVAKDEEVGVYGFIFFRASRWVDVIIDDLLYLRRPKYEELTTFEQGLYLDDKDYYNKSASLNGGKTLYFARSGTEGETWVPLIEKAYAKLHGNYAYLHLGKTCEAMEDLTGGVSKNLFTIDILDHDRFWKDELTKANKDRLFTCQLNTPSSNRNQQSEVKVQGLIAAHAYSILRAVECKGKRFVVLRNPWGKVEWTGRWSDGSKEWTKEWLNVLDELGHSFGEDGQFIMEYNDWVGTFTDIDRTLLFDSSWRMSSHWLCVPTRFLPAAFSYGEVSFKFTLTSAASAVISLAQIDTRYFRDLASRSLWTLDFVVVKEGEDEPLIESPHTKFQARDVSVEAYLEAGTYIAYARLDRIMDSTAPVELNVEDWQLLKLSRIMTKRAEGRSVASNFNHTFHEHVLPKPLTELINRDKQGYLKNKRKEDAKKRDSDGETQYFTDDDSEDNVETVTTTTTTVVVKKTKTKNKHKSDLGYFADMKKLTKSVQDIQKTPSEPPRYNGHARDTRVGNVVGSRFAAAGGWSRPESPTRPEPPKDKLTNYKIVRDDENSLYLGLRVYVNTADVVEIAGRIGDKAEEASEEDEGSRRGRSRSRSQGRSWRSASRD